MNKNSPASIRAQFIKDLSFEIPGIDKIFNLNKQASEKPHVKVNMNVKANNIADKTKEVTLNILIEGELKKEKIFILEVAYSAIVQFQTEDKSMIEKICYIETPAMLFPFARAIIANITREGGLFPIILDPVNFFELFEQSKKIKNSDDLIIN